MSVTKLLACSLIIFICSCTEKPRVEGLWQLEKVDIDMIPRGFKPTFIRFDDAGSFSVSKEEGDLIGLYSLSGNTIRLRSDDERWFSSDWQIKNYQDQLIFKGLKTPYKVTELRFAKTTEFPSFEEFLEQLDGIWQLYKIAEASLQRKVSNTHLTIKEESYQITENDSILEEGSIAIDSRHRKIVFENEKIAWEARFVWDELRLENNELGITYRLRKLD